MIKKGSNVIVLVGKDKNKTGEIGLNASSLIPVIRDLINKWIKFT